MEAYIEFVILDNFMITWLTAAAACRFLHVRAVFWRLFACAALGTLAAVFFPFLRLPNFVLILLKLTLGMALSVVLFARRSNLIQGFAVFMVVTFMFGGLLFCVSLMRYGDVERALSQPATGLPVGVLLLFAALLYLLCRRLFIRYNRRRDAVSGVVPVQIGLLGQTLRVKGFLDTGNRLYDSKTGLPVVLLRAKALVPILSDTQLTQLLNGGIESLFPSAHAIACSGFGGENKRLLVVNPQSFCFYHADKVNIIRDVMIGLSFTKLTDAVEYDLILHSALL